MRFQNLLSIALISGSTMAMPINLHFFKRLSGLEHISDINPLDSISTAPLPTTTTSVEQYLKARQDIVYETVYVSPDQPAPTPDNQDNEVVTVTVGVNQPAATSDSVATFTSNTISASSTTSNSDSSSVSTSASVAVTVSKANDNTPSSNSNGFPKPEAVTYSPYNDDSSCKTSDQVYSDLSKIASLGIRKIRVYGTDCNSISTIEPNAVKLGLKINQGFWIGASGVDSIDSGVQDLINWVHNENGGDWGLFTTLTIGNEAIYGGFVDGSTLLAKIKSVKSTLRSAGWSGSVTTAEPPQSYIDFPNLCTDTDGIDYVGLNVHPYFDANTAPADAGNFVLSQIEIAQRTCNNRNVQITETGYPSAGNTNGKAVPTKDNQATAIKSILSATNNNCVLFTLYDDKWKTPGPYNVEQYFGFIDLY
jgi:exo-beta-1,3-glucanase (GH17 family)